MKLPRDVSGATLIKKLQKIGYEPIRQTGSHIRLTYKGEGKEHHVSIPQHKNLRVGTLNKILSDLAIAHGKTKQEMMKILFP